MAQETQTGALYQPRGVGWGGKWEGGSKGGYMYTYEGALPPPCIVRKDPRTDLMDMSLSELWELVRDREA